MSDDVATLDTGIAKLERRLSGLKVRRRAFVAGRASGAKRQHAERNAAVRAEYRASNGSYGRIEDLAYRYELSSRQIRRILRQEDSRPPDPTPALVVPLVSVVLAKAQVAPPPRRRAARIKAATGERDLFGWPD